MKRLSAELRDGLAFEAAFGAGWRLEALREARYDTRVHRHGAPAWLATLTRA